MERIAFPIILIIGAGLGAFATVHFVRSATTSSDRRASRLVMVVGFALALAGVLGTVAAF